METKSLDDLIAEYTLLAKRHCKRYHPMMVPPKLEEKTKLRTDGMYVQFGLRPWKNEYWTTSNKWYNLIRLFDDKHAVLFGTAEHVFYDAIGKTDRSNLGVTDPTDVLQTMQELAKIPIENFFDPTKLKERHGIAGYFETSVQDQDLHVTRCNIRKEAEIKPGIEPWYVQTPIHGGHCACTILKAIKGGQTNLGWAQSAWCNDDFTFYHKGDPCILYDYGSPCRVECLDDGEARHDFPAYFIPFDFSETERWKDILAMWSAKGTIQ